MAELLVGRLAGDRRLVTEVDEALAALLQLDATTSERAELTSRCRGLVDAAAVDCALTGQLAVSERVIESPDGPVPVLVVLAARASSPGAWHGCVVERRPDGERLPATATPATDAGREARELAETLRIATFAVTIQRLDGVITYWNAAAERLYGWAASEALDRHITELVGETDHVIFDELTRRISATGSWTGRVENVDRNGRRFPIQLHAALIRDDAGEPFARLSIADDISDLVQLETRAAKDQRLESLGHLTGGIAHDFNNILTVILTGAELLAGDLDDPELVEIADAVQQAAERGAMLTNRLLVFASRQSLQPEIVDIGALVDELVPLLRHSFLDGTRLEVRHEPESWPALVDRGQLEVALLNVAANARDAGASLVRVSVTDRPAGSAPQQPGVVDPGDVVCIAVTDDGVGMPSDVVVRAFEPFFTTKPPGRGSGMGLSMLHGFVQQSGGVCEIKSQEGVGTTVEIHLPRARDGEGPLHRSGAAPVEDRFDETVLLVDDDPLVRHQVARQMRSLGCSVVEASGAVEALALLRSRADVDVLVTDVVMPDGASGFELATTARQTRPDLRVLFVSGHLASEAIGGQAVPGEVLRKPFRRDALADALRRLLRPGR